MNEVAASILANNKYCVISTTAADGSPWSVPVHYADDGSAIYWLSNNKTIHSQNITRDGRAFIVIFDSRQEEKGAVYSSTIARELTGSEAEEARVIYLQKWPDRSSEKFQEWSIYSAPLGVLDGEKSNAALLYYFAKEAA